MPYLETPGELADAIADLCGIYGAHDDGAPSCNDPRRSCRMCFTSAMAIRIRGAVANEAVLASPDKPEGGD